MCYKNKIEILKELIKKTKNESLIKSLKDKIKILEKLEYSNEIIQK